MQSQPNSVGGLTFAFGSQYQRLAYALALSLKYHDVPLTVVVPSSDIQKGTVHPRLMQEANVVGVDGGFNKFEYEALAYDLSPYHITVKFDADVLIPSDAYFGPLVNVVNTLGIASGSAHDLEGGFNASTVYRRIETSLDIPTVYSAFFGFKKSDLAKEFFEKVKYLFKNWYAMPVLSKNLPPTTDTIYSIAWKVVCKGNPKLGLPFLHMKPGIAGSKVPDKWVDKLPYVVDDYGRLRINSHAIRLPFHYYDKSFMTDTLIERLENYVCSS